MVTAPIISNSNCWNLKLLESLNDIESLKGLFQSRPFFNHFFCWVPDAKISGESSWPSSWDVNTAGSPDKVTTSLIIWSNSLETCPTWWLVVSKLANLQHVVEKKKNMMMMMMMMMMMTMTMTVFNSIFQALDSDTLQHYTRTDSGQIWWLATHHHHHHTIKHLWIIQDFTFQSLSVFPSYHSQDNPSQSSMSKFPPWTNISSHLLSRKLCCSWDRRFQDSTAS